ncbi:hypothetical protein Tco_0096664 [Tanacetum coccineum]
MKTSSPGGNELGRASSSANFSKLSLVFTGEELGKGASDEIVPVQGPNTNGTDEDIVKSTKKPTPTVIVKRPVPIKGCVLGLANVKTWDSIVKKFGVRKPGSCADKTKGKRKLSGVVLLLEPRCLLDNLCGSWLLCAFDNVLVRLPLDVGLVKTAQTRSFTTPRLLYYSLQCCNR